MAFFGCCKVDRPERSIDSDGRPRRSATLGPPQATKAGIGCVFHADSSARMFRVAAMLPGPAKSSGQVGKVSCTSPPVLMSACHCTAASHPVLRQLEIGDTLYAVDGRIVHPANTPDLASLIIGPPLLKTQAIVAGMCGAAIPCGALLTRGACLYMSLTALLEPDQDRRVPPWR